MFKKIMVLVFAIILIPMVANAYVVTLTWDKPTLNTDGTLLTDLSGFVVYYGTQSGVYTNNLNVGNVDTFQWDVDEAPGTVLFFNVSAFDLGGNDSGFNGEVEYTVPFPVDLPPMPPTNLMVQ